MFIYSYKSAPYFQVSAQESPLLVDTLVYLLSKDRHCISYAPVPIPGAEVSSMNKT